ncbi:hypothetical protein TcG_05947 [Trypanosoma cruzi]|nr:hypothetical protein TcG_05947 [Trypanosoma cruzi]
MIRKGFLSHLPPAILTSPESGMKTAPHPWSDASAMMTADAFSVGLMFRLRLFSMLCRNLSPKPTTAGGRFAGDVSCTIPRLSADNHRRTALMKSSSRINACTKWPPRTKSVTPQPPFPRWSKN